MRHTRISAVWESLRTSYWFVPSLMSMGAVALAFIAIWVDRQWKVDGVWFESWITSSGPEGVRSLLNAVAGSMITIAGVTFSITIVALSLASQQFGPRMLYNFMRDRGNQIVLGAFVSTFIYSMILLRSVDKSREEGFVPDIAVTVGMLLTLGSLGILIYFIHHISASIQADNVVAAVTDDLNHTIDRICGNSHRGDDGAEHCLIDGSAQPPAAGASDVVHSHHGGYIEAIDEDELLRVAARVDVTLRLRKRAGHFVITDEPIADASPPGRLDEAARRQVRYCFIYGTKRTHTQDIEFGIDQLVEIALRALSPATHDPFTACMCVDRLGESLARVLKQGLPAAARWGPDGKVRLITMPPTFDGIVEAAFNKIRQSIWPHVAVAVRILEVITTLGGFCRIEAHRQPLRQQARMVMSAAERHIDEPADLQDVRERFDAAMQALHA